jgi:succinoglycan biosynthesis protein ExoM
MQKLSSSTTTPGEVRIVLTVENATGEYLLFIDDDEVASPEWIRRMLKTLEEFEADGAFGPVIPVFDEEIPLWKRHRDLYYSLMQSTGENPVFKWTGNCVLRASLLKNMKEPFDPRYGTTGGEDSHLFERLDRQGARFVYCREALVSEYLSPARTTVSGLFLRGLRYGSAHTRRKIDFAGGTRIGLRMLLVMKALVYGTIGLFFMIACFPSPLRRTKWLMKFASNVGRLMSAIGWNYEFYL